MKNLRIGGQAVVEGVTMRSDHFVTTAIRKPNGKIKIKSRKFVSLSDTTRFLNIPIIRGIVSLIEVMSLGIKEITWSSNESLNKNEKMTNKDIIFMVIFSIIFGLALFKLLPWFLASKAIPLDSDNQTLINIIDAIIKTLILICYLLIISRMSDVKTLFQYHGAEHKVVTCYERKIRLTPENAQKFSTIHPRCGTTFIIFVFFISMILYIFIPMKLGFWLNLIVRIALLPIIAGISYELIRFAGRHYYKSKIVRILIWPGLQFQRLTTRQPTLKQLEVSIASLTNCLKEEKQYNK